MSDQVNKKAETTEELTEILEASGVAKVPETEVPQTSRPIDVKRPFDPYIMFKEMESMRQAGMPREIIDESYKQFMDERVGKFRKPQRTLRKTPDTLKIPSQTEINKIYEGLVNSRKRNPDLAFLLQELDKARKAKEALPSVKPKVTLKMRGYRILYFGLSKFLSAVIWVFNKAGIK